MNRKQKRWHYQFMTNYRRVRFRVLSNKDPYFEERNKVKSKPGFLPIRKHGQLYYNYKRAKKWAKQSGIISSRQWRNNKNLPEYIPQNPQLVYIGYGWTTWENFLGREYPPLSILKKFARMTGITSQREWRMVQQAGFFPDCIPATPENVYTTEKWIRS